MGEDENAMQYAKMGGTLIPVGATIPRLDAGFYNVVRSEHGWGVAPAKPVSDDLIDIPGTPADEVMHDITKFLATKHRYMRVGLTHKRGYLLHGPPGTGKTSLGLMVGRRFVKDADGVVFFIPNSGLLSIATDIIRAVEPGRPVMFLMEEADSFLNDVIALSILDGELSLAGAVFVAMTNHREKMPPRIANRPGRFDRVMYVGAPPRAVQVEYFKRLIARLGEDHGDAPEHMATALEGIDLSMGHLREAFVSHILMGATMSEIAERFRQMAGSGGAPELDQHDAGIELGTCDNCGDTLDRYGECPDGCDQDDDEG